MLDQHYYLQSERFQKHRDMVVQRIPPIADACPRLMSVVFIRLTPTELLHQLDGLLHCSRRSWAARRRKNARMTPKAIVAPHIDFHRGGPAYAWAYKSLVESAGADLYILLGTSHCSGHIALYSDAKGF